ncbi:MAG: glycosyltransferase family 4 protein [Alphaproteobacteria bacterium]|nr:glycosyltransferase family 4 protein [Alphaproteobacteria bacterium]
MIVLNVTYNKGKGGLECIYLRYIEMLSKAGHEVCALLPPKSAIKKDVTNLIPSAETSKLISSPINRLNPLAVWKLKKAIQHICPDIILIHNSRPVAFFNRITRNIYPVVTIHHGGKTTRLLKHSKHIICVTKYMVEELKEHGFPSENLYYIPNAIDLDKEYVQRNLPPKEKPLTIGVIGRFTEEKGLDTFIDALKHINIPHKAIIAGCGALREQIRNRAIKQNTTVKFLGWIDEQPKNKFFEQCDVLIVPSRHESFGLTILEAWKHGLPILSSNTKGGTELIEHGKNGLLFERDNPQALAQSVHDLVALKNKSTALTKNGYELLKSTYSTEIVANNLEKTIQKIISQHR